ncbi:MAG: hypothetical protein MUD10_00450 [Candidatus Pacebacteria bacterium]|jgi:hypothetical protein|nr:hypothetical protein [Candidatus Paceibacterota bacterium]
MDKKVVYYIVAGLVLVATIGVIIAMQKPGNQGPVTPPTGGGETNPATSVQKTEIEVAQDLAKEAGGVGMPLRITMEDNGQTVSLTPGKNLVLMLGTDYNWTITSSDEAVIAKRNITIGDARVQAVYQAVSGGSAALTASGTCKAASCAQPNPEFKLNVEARVTEKMTPTELMK